MAPPTVSPALSAGPTACPDANVLAAIFASDPSSPRPATLDHHLDVCADCRELVSELARGRAMPEVAPPPSEPAIEDGREATYIDRYLLLERIGAGGMGTVYSAYDAELDRRIAIKILHDTGVASGREAQAIARVTHENVVSVFDVGTDHDAVFIAMELVEGTTLAAWLRETPRPRAEILRVFVAAGRGLAAAHAAGVVHGDFKPDNVLVGHDGVVRVTDFGLAHRSGDVAPRGGTEAYMSPEQRAGGIVDARSDQYAYCVALARALVEPTPHLERVLARGRAEQPSARFATMDALLEALQRDPWRARRRIAAVLCGVLVVAGGGALIEHRLAGAPAETCTGAAASIAGVWAADRELALHAAFTASGQPYAEATWSSFSHAITRYRDAWVVMHTEACVATRVHETQSEQVLDQRMACLEDRRRELAAFLRAYEHPAPAAIETAASAAQRLSPVDTCGDLAALRRGEGTPGDLVTSSRRAALRGQLSEAKGDLNAGRFAAGLELANAAVTGARMLGDQALLGEALLVRSNLLAREGKAPEAERGLYDAIAAADRASADEVRATAWIDLVRVVGRDQAKLAQAKTFAALARAASQRLDGPAPSAKPKRAAALAFALAPVLTQAGELDDAERTAREALALEEQIGGPDNLDLATALEYVGNVEIAKGQYAAAADLFARAVALVERVLGAEHPRVAAALDNRGIAAFYAGHYEDALADHRRAIAIRERVLGPDHPDLAVSLANSAVDLTSLDQPARAAAAYERAIQIFERARGADHPTLATFHMNLGSAYAELGRRAEAHAEYQRALAIQERTLGPTHGDVGLTRAADAEVFLDEHRDREALAGYERALAILEGALGPKHPDVATALVGIGRAQLALGHRPQGVAALERALAIDLASTIAAETTAGVQFALARALGPTPRARELAVAAERAFAAAGPSGRAERADVQRWLARCATACK